MNNLLLKNVLVLFVISLIAFQSCNKDTSLTEQEQIDPTEQKILNFKEKMKKGDKSGETMTIEDAVWNIEAALNYTHGYHETAEVILIDSIFVPINISENEDVVFSDVIAAYNQIENGLINILGDNNMSIADIEFIQNSDKSGESTLKMTTIVKGVIPNLLNFGETDYWKPFWGGKCGAYEGQYTDRSALTEIPRKANLLRAYPVNGYITDISTVDFFPYDNYDYQDYLFYQSGHNNVVPFEQACLNPTEMNYWLAKIKLLASDYTPTGKEIVGYNMDWAGYDVVDGPWYYTHTGHISYGIFHSGSPIH